MGNRSRKVALVVASIVVAAAVASCTSRPAVEDPAGERTEAVATPTPVEVVDEPQVLAVWSADPEPATLVLDVDVPGSGPLQVETGTAHGLRLQVTQARFDGDTVELAVLATNDQETEVHLVSGFRPGRDRDLELTDDVGTSYPFVATEDDEAIDVPAGEAIEARLRFFGTPPREASTLALRFNVSSEPDDVSEAYPLLHVDVPLSWSRSDDGMGFRQVTHPGRVALRVVGVETAATHTTLEVETGGRHAADIDVVLDDAGVLLSDDRGGTYPLVPGEEMALEPARLYTGRWTFAGPLDPQAEELSVVTNAEYAGGRVGSDPRTGRPSMEVTGIPVPSREDLPSQLHPGGAAVAVSGVAVHADRIAVRILAINGGNQEIVLDDGGVALAVDGGARIPLDDDVDLTIPANRAAAITLVFPRTSETVPDAIRLVVNAGVGDEPPGDEDDRFTYRPLIEVEAPVADPPTGAGATGWPEADAERSTTAPIDLPRSTLEPRELVMSSAERVERLLFELHAEAAPEGILVTFPDDVLFGFDRDDLSAEGIRLLEGMAEVIAYYEDAPVRVEGHTDSRGTPEYNQDLSERRARTVADQLVEAHGIDAARLEARGFGLDRPVADNAHPDGSDNPEGRARNRRVEILIVTEDRSLLPEE